MADTEIIKPGYSRVSQIASMYSDFESIDPAVLNRKCEIGTEVHDYIETIFKARKAEKPPEFKHDRSYLYLNSFKAFCNNEFRGGIVPIEIEKRFYCDRLMITGKIDLFASYSDNLVLIDWKTSASVSLPSWTIQQNLYKYLLEQNKYTCYKAYIVQLKQTPTYKLHDIDISQESMKKALQQVKDFKFLASLEAESDQT